MNEKVLRKIRQTIINNLTFEERMQIAIDLLEKHCKEYMDVIANIKKDLVMSQRVAKPCIVALTNDLLDAINRIQEEAKKEELYQYFKGRLALEEMELIFRNKEV